MSVWYRSGERAADAAPSLADAVLVLHEGEAHEALTTGAEADAGRHRDLGLTDQQLRELEAAELLVRTGHGRPHEHRAFRLLDLPPDARQAVEQRVAPMKVDLIHFLWIVRSLVHRDDRRDLDGLERSVVEIALQLRE